ncbi:permease [Enterococcus sp. JM4C]|uniref:ABC transporter permease n=1 Tax=Candidatus Enterococcus huntleyi TaxID=1857217 RepID=UPI00137B0C8B|nr:ABC transporter permease [Enterococcus sp. JM4C]KAF1297316.1 permease [Enterococcus sp. JM4C]
MKFTDILKSASSNLWRNKGRTILTIVAIFIGAFTISVTTGVNIGVNDYIDKQVNSVGASDMLVVQPLQPGMTNTEGPEEYQENTQAGTQEMIAQDDLKTMEGLKNVEKAEAYLIPQIDYIQGQSDKKYVFQASPSSELARDMEVGREVSTKSEKYEVTLSPEYVESLGYKSAKDAIGKTVTLAFSSPATKEQKTVSAEVVGVQTTSLVNGGDSVINPALADEVFKQNNDGLPEAMKENYYIATLTMEKGLSKDKITDLKNELEDKGFLAMTVEDQIGMIRQVINAITGVLTMFGAIALLAASFGIINTLYMSVQDRTREIGLMKAMGMSSGKIFLMFSTEALLIGFWGSVLGVLGAMGAGGLINNIAATSFLDGLTGFSLVQFSIPSVLMIMAIIMLIAFLAGTLPANRAARLDPINALRYE